MPYGAVIFWREAVFRFLAVTTLAEAVKPKYGYRHITASAHQGGNFTAGNLPTITLNLYPMKSSKLTDYYSSILGVFVLTIFNFLR